MAATFATPAFAHGQPVSEGSGTLHPGRSAAIAPVAPLVQSTRDHPSIAPIALRSVAAITAFATRAEPASTAGASDLCLGIDDSGSMWAATDRGPASDPGPNPLRAQAARVAVSLLGADVNDAHDGVGVVLFGTADRPGEDIVVLPVTELSSNSAREALYARIDASLWSKGFTRIDRALSNCLVVLSAAQPQPAQARIVLVTDGVPEAADPRFDANGQLGALAWTLDELTRRGWHVDVILLGPTAQGIADDTRSFANRIADATSGHVYVAGQPTDLLHIYTGIVASMTGRTLMSGDPVDLAKNSSVPVRVEERTAMMTITVVKSDIGTTVRLLTPDGADAADQITRTSTGLVETITVHEPNPGLWSLRLQGQGQAYVSLVLKPADAPAPVPTTSPAPAAKSSSASSHQHAPLRAIGVAVIGACAALAGAWFVRRRIADTTIIGVAASTDSMARVTRLEDLARRYRLLGIWPRPLPLRAVSEALHRDGAIDGAVMMRDKQLLIARRTDAASHLEISPVEYGRSYAFASAPPVELVFGRTIEDLPRGHVVVKSAEVRGDAKHDPDDNVFAHAAPSPSASTSPAEEPAVAVADRLAVLAGDDDAW